MKPPHLYLFLTSIYTSRKRQHGGNGTKRAFLPPPAGVALVCLLVARLVSALFNIIHDCDEVYNYWEPLHYLMYGQGMQTWEYSAAFALRSWWYLLLHALAGWPVAAVVGSAHGKIVVFYAIKATLAIVSALTEWFLYCQVRKRYNEVISAAFLAFLCISSGLFVAASGLLPSSFTMYAMTTAAAALLMESTVIVVASAVIGVIWGWCVAGPAFLPYALWVLVSTPLPQSFGFLFMFAGVALAPLVVADRLFYGNWKASLWNFLVYNVAGGGQSSLYGVEDATFYIRNGLNQLQLVLPLSLMLPLLASGTRLFGHRSKKGVDGKLMVCISPLFVWLAAITALPHKEERFLYVVYPLACLSAAAALDILGHFIRSLVPGRTGAVLSHWGIRSALFLTAVLSLSRSMALVTYYSAPLNILSALPPNAGTPTAPVNVCIGAEWHRFPSAFFLPGPNYRLHFVKSGFSGLLPVPFDGTKGGSRAAPPHLNDLNAEEPDNYWESAKECHYMVTMGPEDGEAGGQWWDGARMGAARDWEVVSERRFVDGAASPMLSRALYIPWWSSQRNTWLRYVLLRKV